MVARLTLMQREFDGSNLRAVSCPAAVPVAAVAPVVTEKSIPAKKQLEPALERVSGAKCVESRAGCSVFQCGKFS